MSSRSIAALAVLALAVFGGTAVAAKLITGGDIKNHSITGKDIRKASIPLKALAGSLPGGATGPQGTQGQTGATGTRGATGVGGALGATGPSGATQFAHTVIVKSSGTAAQNGAALTQAIAGITDAGSTNPYLVKLEPGAYNVGAGLTAKSFVDIEGSGRDNTRITTGSGGVSVPNSTFLRELSVSATATGSATNLNAIALTGPSSGLEDITVTASGEADVFAIRPGGSGSVVIDRADATATSSGASSSAEALAPASILSVTARESSFSAIATDPASSAIAVDQGHGATIDIDDSTLMGTAPLSAVGLDQFGAGTITVTESSVQASGTGLGVSANGGTIHIAGSLVSSAQTNSGVLTCINSYKSDFTTATGAGCN